MTLDELQLAVSRAAWIDESQAVQTLLQITRPHTVYEAHIESHAEQLINNLREDAGGGIEAFLHEYGLNTSEGIALMCLAEALLRIPDARTADALIKDKFEHTHWEKHLGCSEHWFVNASSWGLMLTGKMVDLTQNPANIISKLFAKIGEPSIREALRQGMKIIGSRFVLGETISAALSNGKSSAKKGYRYSFDMLGEAARSQSQALAFMESYRHAITAIAQTVESSAPFFARPNISIKLSALHPRYELTQADRVMNELLPRLKELVLLAKEGGISVSLDAEEAARLDIEMALFRELATDPCWKGYDGLGFVVQAYQKAAPALLDWLAALAAETGLRFPVRLVKGAYWDAEIKRAQIEGLRAYPVYTHKEHTDLSYLACATKLLSQPHCFYPQFATHNARTIADIMALATAYNIPESNYEFQRLHGMGEALHDVIVNQVPSRIYAPVGEHKDLLAYLIRRLLENGANTSFVHLLMDHNISVRTLSQSPITAAQALTHNSEIAPPAEIYQGVWKNSRGVSLGHQSDWQPLSQKIAAFSSTHWQNLDVSDKSAADVSNAIKAALNAQPEWEKTGAEARATILESIADALENTLPEWIALCQHEAKKTTRDSIAEVREAADFCRYYAQSARNFMATITLPSPTGESNRLHLHARGVIACISPWNFPLAIFVGQVVAALVTGNAVIAKPAEQTPRIAARAVEMMHQCGIPKQVLQLICGRGEVVGAALTEHPAIGGVVFTGSFETAQHIQRSLSHRRGAMVPFIAETGGLNCMVVDSTALIEQAVDDIVASAFGSAGQRCSALRVLYVQADIADALMALLAGAMQELRIGNPQLISTDIGPLIDEDAQRMVNDHIEKLKNTARLVAKTPLDDSLQGHFVTPHAFEIQSIEQLSHEVFGPVLHIIRFKSTELHTLASHINATGYGLTFGIHSRIQEHIDYFCENIRAGNIYVNRSMIGATVGVQPFGGEGLSGTGPKAGGPHYLSRFVTERTISNNITAIGGNVGLLAG